MKTNMQHTTKYLFIVLGIALLSGCATSSGHNASACNGKCNTHCSAAANDSRSNLDEADRANHNSLLPASFYASNHLLDD